MIQISQICCFVVVAILVGCATPQQESMPSPTVTEYFKTEGGGFISSGSTLQYAVLFKVRKPVNGSQPWFAAIEFENPENAAAPIVASEQFSPTQLEISVHSRELKSIKNHKTYSVKVLAYADSAKTKPITVHEMFVRFDVPDQTAPTFGVKLL